MSLFKRSKSKCEIRCEDHVPTPESVAETIAPEPEPWPGLTREPHDVYGVVDVAGLYWFYDLTAAAKGHAPYEVIRAIVSPSEDRESQERDCREINDAIRDDRANGIPHWNYPTWPKAVQS